MSLRYCIPEKRTTSIKISNKSQAILVRDKSFIFAPYDSRIQAQATYF